MIEDCLTLNILSSSRPSSPAGIKPGTSAIVSSALWRPTIGYSCSPYSLSELSSAHTLFVEKSVETSVEKSMRKMVEKLVDDDDD